MMDLTNILDDLTQTYQALEEEMSYIEISGQWRDTVHEFTRATGLLKHFHQIHAAWLKALEQT